ncbi:MAG TPA: M67 family peptidase [Cycloclasticus sp.]|jgi:proteasome lid subunit RPN8/RPN11|nr:M67 family peptidase [Cycloclasticus sp.]
MHTKELELPRKLVNELLHYAQLSNDQEVCGLIGKNSADDYTFYPVNNVAEEPSTRFLMAPEEQISAMKKINNDGQTLFAIYHSHPTAPATPSAIDIELTSYPDAYYLIVSLNTKGVLEMRCFQLLHDENITEITLRMKEA